MDKLLGRRPKPEAKPQNCVSRYVCVKHSSWRGKYKRILCVTTGAVVTQNPERGLTVTNVYLFADRTDIDGISIGADPTEFILSARQDEKSKYKPLKFTCVHRTSLLTDLFQCMAAATAVGKCLIATKILGAALDYPALRWSETGWQPCTLRLSAFGLEEVEGLTGATAWRCAFQQMGSPGVSLLVSVPGSDAPGVFAIHCHHQHTPQVYSCQQRDQLLGGIQTLAKKKLGVKVTVDGAGQYTKVQLDQAIAQAERQYAGQASEVPLGQWEVDRLQPRHDLLPPYLLQCVPTQQAKRIKLSYLEGGPAGGSIFVVPGANVVHRRLIITSTSVLERRMDSYDVVTRRPLNLVAALVRSLEDPKMLAIEWCDGVMPTQYLTPERDALLATLLDAAQLAAGRPIAVMPGYTDPSDVIISPSSTRASHSARVEPDQDLEKLFLEELQHRAKEVYPILQNSGSLFYHAHISFPSSPLPPEVFDGPLPSTSPSDSSSSGPLTPTHNSVAPSGSRPPGKFMIGNRDAGRRLAGPPPAPDAMTPAEAADLMMEVICEFNACVPYQGVNYKAEMDGQTLLVVLAMLPDDLQPQNATVHLNIDEVKQAVAVLHCVQRLVSAPLAAEALLSSPGAMGRLFACLSCDSSHVIMEAARLLVRLWSPPSGRKGTPPWIVPRGAAAVGAGIREIDDFTQDDDIVAKTSKALCFTPSLLIERCEVLLAPLKSDPPASALTTMALVEALAAVVVPPGSRTTDTLLADKLLMMLADLGSPLFRLFNHSAGRVSEGAAVLMRAIAECGSATAAPMRLAALREGALLHHLLLALYGKGNQSQLSRELVASWADECAPALALIRRIFPPGMVRHLNSPKTRPRPPPPPQAPNVERPGSGEDRIQETPKRPSSGPEPPGGAPTITINVPPAPPTVTSPKSPVVPGGSVVGDAKPPPPRAPAGQEGEGPDGPPAVNGHHHTGGTVTSAGAQGDTPGVARAEGHAVASSASPVKPLPTSLQPEVKSTSEAPYAQIGGGLKGNWDAFWSAISRDHCHAGLVWNATTRSELRDALDKEEAMLKARRQRMAQGLGGYPVWNYAEFVVDYPSLSRHVCIGGVYVRLLLEGVDQGAVEKVANPREFFHALYHHALCAGVSRLLSLNMQRGMKLVGGLPSGLDQQEREREEATLETQVLCVRAMAAVANAHAGAIGPFEGMAHLVEMTDLTMSLPLRHALLRLIQALLMPAAVAQDIPQVDRAVQGNSYAFIRAGGLELLVDLASCAHEQQERWMTSHQQLNKDSLVGPQGPSGAVALLMADSSYEPPRVWYCYPHGVVGEGQKQTIPSTNPATHELLAKLDETGRAGPLSRKELLSLFNAGHVHMTTPCWASGMQYPLPASSIRELRWSLARGSKVLGSFQVAEVALKVLHRLALLQPAVNDQGQVFQPLPQVHRALTAPRCLPHLCQVMLTNEPSLVTLTATLLEEILHYADDACAKLYLTGLFFFALAYGGSNLTAIARLFKVTHLRQTFRGTLELQSGLPLAQRSFLGQLLPVSLLYMLECYGSEVFAEALAGDHDTPELIWTYSMRHTRLIPQVLQHLGEFPLRLVEHHQALYDYLPIPPLTYPELSTEIWCHRYYLRNLCDEARFHDWVIVDHIPMLQALLSEWRAELQRKPLSMSEVEAYQVLGLSVSNEAGSEKPSEEDVRRAYRNMARKYHPDKNPQGRVQFLAIQKAYERLQAGTAGGEGPQGWRLLLMLRAQCILFGRYSSDLRPFKYAGYLPLLEEITQAQGVLEGGGPYFLSGDTVKEVLAAVELCWLTCVCTHLNAEELRRSGGVQVLAGLLSRCLSAINPETPPQQPPAVIVTNTLRTFAGLCAVHEARLEIAELPGLVADIVRCCALASCPSSVDAALICICHMSASSQLQMMMLEAGILGYVIPLLMCYDVTMSEESSRKLQVPFQYDTQQEEPTPEDGDSADEEKQDAQSRQDADLGFKLLNSPLVRASLSIARSHHALLAVRALARLAGMLPAPHQTPTCDAARAVLTQLLTEALAARLARVDPREVLAQLNSSMETPQVIWNNSMRQELVKMMEAQREAPDMTALVNFQYQSLRKELQVEGVFVRVFNAKGTATLAGQDSSNFCKGLVRYLFDKVIGQASGGRDITTKLSAEDVHNVLDVLQALTVLLEAEPRLLGLLSSKSALSPLVACLVPAATASRSRAEESFSAASTSPGGETHIAQDEGTVPNATTVVAEGGKAHPRAQHELSHIEGTPGDPSGVSTIEGPRCSPPPAISPASLNQLTEQVLTLLMKVTQHSGCVEAIVDETFLRYLFWMLFVPKQYNCLMLTLKLLYSLAGQSLTALVAGYQGGTLYLLFILLHMGEWPWPGGQCPSQQAEEEVKHQAAAVLGRLLADLSHGPRVVMVMQKLLPEGQVDAVAEGPPEAVMKSLSTKVETPECIWDVAMAATAAAEIATLCDGVYSQQLKGDAEWTPPPGPLVQYSELEGEMYVGGVYVRKFMKDPKYPLRNPKKFVEGLMEMYTKVLEACSQTLPGHPGAQVAQLLHGYQSSPTDTLLVLSAATVALLKAHALLADHIAQLGYIGKLLVHLSHRTRPTSGAPSEGIGSPRKQGSAGGEAAPGVTDGNRAEEELEKSPGQREEAGGTILRLLHQLAAAHSAAEVIATSTSVAVVKTFMQAMSWGEGATILVLETLKRLLSISNRRRDLLVGQSLNVGLVPALLDMLDWRKGAPAGRGGGAPGGDTAQQGLAVQRALAVDVLRLMEAEGPHAAQASQLLRSSPIWTAYRDQSHDMFLPSGASVETGVVGLLQGGDTARFALPAPESYSNHEEHN